MKWNGCPCRQLKKKCDEFLPFTRTTKKLHNCPLQVQQQQQQQQEEEEDRDRPSFNTTQSMMNWFNRERNAKETGNSINGTEEESVMDSTFAQFPNEHLEIPSMFFSWVAYEEKAFSITNHLLGRKYSEESGYPRLSGCGSWEIVSDFIKDEKLEHIRTLVVRSCEKKFVIVAFRGTELNILQRFQGTINDWMYGCFAMNLVNWKKDKPELGKCHNGFLRHYSSIAEELFCDVRKYFDDGYTIIFTGHSQGGALASYCVLDCAERLPQYRSNMFLITFGSPNIGNSAFVEYFNSCILESQIAHYITSFPSALDVRDCVTQVPLAIFGYCQTKGTVRYVKANEKYFGNPNPIKDVDYQGPRLVLPAIGCHFQQTYMDGILKEGISSQPYIIDVIAQFKENVKKLFDTSNGGASSYNTNQAA
jgi:hypothetical protein